MRKLTGQITHIETSELRVFFLFNCDVYLYQIGVLNNGTEFEHALSEGANPKGTVLVAI